MCLFLWKWTSLLEWKGRNVVILIKWPLDIFKEQCSFGCSLSIGLCCWHDGQLAAATDRSVLENLNSCCWTRAYAPSQRLFCSCVYHANIQVADDRSWPTSTGSVILPAWLFSVSSVVHALWWAWMCSIKISTHRDNSHLSIYMPLTQTSLFLTFPSVSIHHCPVIVCYKIVWKI